jgi:hypothetical protein
VRARCHAVLYRHRLSHYRGVRCIGGDCRDRVGAVDVVGNHLIVMPDR